MKYIDADLLRKEIEHRIDILSDVSIKCAKNDDMEMHNYYHGKAISLDELLSFIDSLQQEQQDKKEVKFVFPKFLYARTTNNKTIDVSYAPQSLDAIEYIRSDSLQQEQPSLPGIEENGIPGKDFIPVEWVDACEMYGKWKIVKVEQPDFPTTDEQIKEFLATHPEIKVPEKYKNPDWLFKKQEQSEVFDTVAFQKGVQEGRRLEREDALTIADIEKLHTFLYAVKNNKQGAFTFTRLTDEQYEEVLRMFNNARKEK